MIISHRHKFIFIHVYKVAGTSISHALRPYSVWPCESVQVTLLKRLGFLPSDRQFTDHVTARELQQQLNPKIFKTYYKFAFVRNPWDWQVSLYKYILKNEKHALHSTVSEMEGFTTYLNWQCSRSKLPPWSLQKNFVTDVDGELIVDFVGRYETLNEDFATALNHLGLDARLPHLNKTGAQKAKSDQYLDYYTSESNQLFCDYYKEDIEMFGYRPPILSQTA